jgi:glutamine synthetase adenylyltransferase
LGKTYKGVLAMSTKYQKSDELSELLKEHGRKKSKVYKALISEKREKMKPSIFSKNWRKNLKEE